MDLDKSKTMTNNPGNGDKTSHDVSTKEEVPIEKESASDVKSSHKEIREDLVMISYILYNK